MTKEPKDTAKKKLPRLSAQNSPFATVLVGPEKKRFVVHQDLLTYHSEFFRAALTGSFKEADEKTVPLPEDNEVIFEFFVHWLYHKEFPTTDNASAELLGQWRNEDKKAAKGNLETDNLIKLHIFADKYGVEKLEAVTLNGLSMHMKPFDVTLPSHESIRHAYKHLPNKSALLNFLVDMQCRIKAQEWAKVGIRGLPSPFIVSVLARLTEKRGKSNVWYQLKLCDYHEHKDEDERKACPHRDVVID